MKRIGAIVLAAGLSTRMGAPKMLLPWGNSTVVRRISEMLCQTDVSEVVVVSGMYYSEIAAELGDLQVQVVYNPDYQNGEMLSSFQAGIQFIRELSVDAVLLVLGDQPQIELKTIHEIINNYQEQEISLIVPSYQNKRGHPWLVEGKYFQEILNMLPGETLRTFLNKHENEIHYLIINSPTIIQDMDTPEDYNKYLPTID